MEASGAQALHLAYLPASQSAGGQRVLHLPEVGPSAYYFAAVHHLGAFAEGLPAEHLGLAAPSVVLPMAGASAALYLAPLETVIAVEEPSAPRRSADRQEADLPAVACPRRRGDNAGYLAWEVASLPDYLVRGRNYAGLVDSWLHYSAMFLIATALRSIATH